MGPSDLETARGRRQTVGRRRPAGPHRTLADHDQRGILQVDRGRGRAKGLGSREYRGTRLHRAPDDRQERPEPGGRRGWLQRTRQPGVHLPLQVLPAGLRWCRQRIPSPLRGRGKWTGLVPGLERRFHLFDCGRVRGGVDHDGKPLRASPLQGRLRPGGCLVPAIQGQVHECVR